jgi:hypothetical protein
MKGNKMLARKIAIAMLSAGMVVSSAPVSAFAADAVSIEASDATYSGQSVTDAEFQAALKTALATFKPNISSADEKATSSIDGKFSGLVVTGYSFRNFKVTGHTAPSYKTTATGGELVMPVLTVTADVQKDSKAYGTITFTCDATSLTKSEQVAAAKAVLEGAGGTSADPAVGAATTYSNTDNSTSLKSFVDAILNSSNTKIANIGQISDVTAKVTQGTVTAATKSAAGSEAVDIELSADLMPADDKADPAWDDNAADQTKNQTVKSTATYTATIPKLGTQSSDDSYQTAVENALKDVTFTNADFGSSTLTDKKNDTVTRATDAGAYTKIQKALDNVGVKEWANTAIKFRNVKKASHKEDGSVEVLLDASREGEASAVQYATVTLPITHADDTVAIGDEISAKIVALVKSYVADSKDITPTVEGKAAQKKEITAKLQAAVEKALSDKLDGTNTIASEIEKVEVSIPNAGFTESTASTNGTISKANVTVTFKDDAPDRTALTNPGAGFDAQPVSGKKKQLTFSYDSTAYGKGITLYKVTAVSATSLTLPEETPYNTLSDNGEIKVTPSFTPAASNNYVIRWTLSDNSKFNFKPSESSTTYAKATAATVEKDIAAGNKTAFLANDGITLKFSGKPGDTATLTAELIDGDGLVAAKASTTLKAYKGFSDVQNKYDYAYNAINYLSQKQTVSVDGKDEDIAVITGIGNNLFNPSGDVTRAQFVTFLYRLDQTLENDTDTVSATLKTDTTKGVYLEDKGETGDADFKAEFTLSDGSKRTQYFSKDYKIDGKAVEADKTKVPYTYKAYKTSAASTKFTDVDANAYYAKAVDWAVANGITSGKTDTTFDPNAKVTRAEAVTFMYRYFAANQSYNAANFTDVPTGAYYANAVGWASANGITQGKTSTVFAPKDTTSRKEAAAFIYRAAEYSGRIAK